VSNSTIAGFGTQVVATGVGLITTIFNTPSNAPPNQANIALGVFETYAPPTSGGPWSDIVFAIVGQNTYTGPGLITGHFGGVLGWAQTNNPGQTVPLMIAVEGRIQPLGATDVITNAIIGEFQVPAVAAGASVTALYGVDSEIAGNSGTITTFAGYTAKVSANSGTITNFYGFFMPDSSGVLAGTTRVSFLSQDSGASMSHAGNIIITGSGKGFSTNSTTMMTTTTSFSNGAGAGAGTITNAPSAGNPTKWVPINDNGTTRYIPAW
jgi:hypothetical protein